MTAPDHEQAERSGAITHYERQLEQRVADLEAQLADEKDRNKARILREQRLAAQLAEAQSGDLWQKVQAQQEANRKLHRKYDQVKAQLAERERALAVLREFFYQEWRVHSGIHPEDMREAFDTMVDALLAATHSDSEAK